MKKLMSLVMQCCSINICQEKIQENTQDVTLSQQIKSSQKKSHFDQKLSLKNVRENTNIQSPTKKESVESKGNTIKQFKRLDISYHHQRSRSLEQNYQSSQSNSIQCLEFDPSYQQQKLQQTIINSSENEHHIQNGNNGIVFNKLADRQKMMFQDKACQSISQEVLEENLTLKKKLRKYCQRSLFKQFYSIQMDLANRKKVNKKSKKSKKDQLSNLFIRSEESQRSLQSGTMKKYSVDKINNKKQKQQVKSQFYRNSLSPKNGNTNEKQTKIEP